MLIVNLEACPWLRSSKLHHRPVLVRFLPPKPGGNRETRREMAAIEAEGFTIKAGMKNSKVRVVVIAFV